MFVILETCILKPRVVEKRQKEWHINHGIPPRFVASQIIINNSFNSIRDQYISSVFPSPLSTDFHRQPFITSSSFKMHFFKTITLAFLSVSAASAFTAPEVRDMALQAESDYLQARDEYIEKRELFRRVSFPFLQILSPQLFLMQI